MRQARDLKRVLAGFSGALFLWVTSLSGQGQQRVQVLGSSLRPEVAQWRISPLGELPLDERLQLSLMLPLRNQDELQSFLQRLQDPSSPDFRKYLTVEQFTAEYGPTEADYQAVIEFAQANGFQVTNTPKNRMLVSINGSVAQINKTFHVTMTSYRHPTEDRSFYAPDATPTINLGVTISQIVGLDNFARPHSQASKAAPGAVHGNTSDFTGSGPNQAMLARDMRAAYYGNGPLTGAGQAVGLVEYENYDINDVVLSFDGEATATANGDNYSLTYTPASGGGPYSVAINNVMIDGGTPLGSDDGEAVLDIVAPIGMAPGISQVVVYISSGSDVDMFNQMAVDNTAKQLSTSWGWSNNAIADDPVFMEFAAQGQTMFVASGDSGAYWYGTPWAYPGDDPYITSVGGTDLVTSGPMGSWVSETGWSQSTGGPGSDGFALPSYQIGLAAFTANNSGFSSTIRNTPDVAADADTNSFNCSMGGCGDWGGTSFASPRWAGFMALVNQQAASAGKAPIGFLNPTIYALAESSPANYAADFHDITSGINNCNWVDCYDPQDFSAGTSYDEVTGWGSPTGQSLIDALVGADTPSFVLTSSGTGATISPGSSWSDVITVSSFFGFDGNVALSTSTLPNGITAQFNPATATPKIPSTVTFSTSNTLTTPVPITIFGRSGNLTESTTITLASPSTCVETPVTGRLTLDNMATWLLETSASVPALPSGFDTVYLAPRAAGSGTWNWSGPNGFASTNRWIGPLSLNMGANNYVVTYTNTSGCVTTQTYVITEYATPGLYVQGPATAVVAQSDSSLPEPILVKSVNGFSSATTLSVSELPSGVTAQLSASTVTPNANGNAQATLTFNATSNAVVGSYAVTVTGTSGSLVNSATIPLMIVNSAATCDGNAPVTQPYIEVNGGNWLISTAQTVGLNTAVSLDMDSINFNNGTWAWTGPNGYTSVSQTDRGIYNVPLAAGLNVFEAVYVEPNNCASTQSFAITAQSDPSPGMMVATPALAVPQSSSGTNTAIVSSLYSFSGEVAMSALGVPSGVTATFSPSTVELAANGSAMPVLTLSVSQQAVPGSYTVMVTATAGSQSASVPFEFDVLAAQGCSPQVTATPYISVNGGNWTSQASATVSTTASVELDLGPNPFMDGEWYWTGPNGYFYSSGIYDAVTSIPLSAGNNEYIGTFISPTDYCQNSIPFEINATTAATFDIAASWPSAVTLSPGNSWTSTINVTSVNGFNSLVALSATGLPSGVTASFLPSAVTPTAGNPASSVLTLKVTSTPVFVSSNVNIIGSSGSVVNHTPIALTIVPTSYTATLTPASLTFAAQATGSTSSSQAVTLTNTGTGTLSLSSIAASGVFSETNGCGATLAPGSSCVISVSFTPVADGTATGSLIVTDNANSNPQTVSLSGTGTGTPCTGNICFSGSFSSPGQYGYTSQFTSAQGTIQATLTAPANASWSLSLINSTLNLVVSSQGGVGSISLNYSATPGIYELYISTASGSGAWRIAGSYPPPASFNLSDSPATLTVTQGKTGTSAVTVTSLSGFSSAVSFNVSGLPSGVSALFSPSSVTPAANGTAESTLTLNVASTAAFGSYAATVTGSSGSLTSTTPINLTVIGGPPIGNLEAVVDASTGSTTVSENDSLIVSGWVADPEDGSPMSNVKVYVDGSLFGTPTMGIARADVASYFSKPGWANSGFQLVASAASLSSGSHAVTVVAIDSSGRSITLGPKSISVTGLPPIGNLEAVVDASTGSTTVSENDSLIVSGWVADPVDGSPMSNVKVYIDGSLFGTPTMGIARADVASCFGKPAWANSGFQLTASAASLSAGFHAVTVVAIDSGSRSITLGPKTISVTGGPPIGNLEAVFDASTGSTTVSENDSLFVSGWVADPVDGSPMSNVKVYVDGSLFGTPTMGIARADVASCFGKPAWANSGFQLTASAALLSAGSHSVTVVAIDSGGRSITLGPKSISVTGVPPIGNLEAVVDASTGSTTVSENDSLLVSGWVADPVDGAPMSNVKVYVDGSLFGTPTKGIARADVASCFGKPAWANSGFQLTASAVTLSPGSHAVTVVAIDSGGRSITLGPKSISVTGGPPIGNLEAAVDASTGSTTVSKNDSLIVSGWVADPVDGSPMSNVKVYVDGSLFGTPTMSIARADVASYFGKPAWANSGFQLTASAASLSSGSHAVTVVAIDSGGRSITLGPKSISVTGGN
ncbi:MAG: protease pro-enzyme activation domain-containing protein [Terracidiphilus sp.]